MKKIILMVIAVLTGITLSYAESCKDSAVKTEYKPDIENCKSQKRTCCEDGNWSDWDADCEKHEGCFNGTTWEKEPDSSTEYETSYLPESEKKFLQDMETSYSLSGVFGKYKVVTDDSFKYKRTNCTCEEGKGYRCYMKYNPIKYAQAYAYMEVEDLDDQNIKKISRLYSARLNAGRDGYGDTVLGGNLFNLLNPPEGGSYQISGRYGRYDITGSVSGNLMKTCKYVRTFMGKDNEKYFGVSFDIIPKLGYYNVTVNGHKGDATYSVYCYFGELSGPSVEETAMQ